MTETVKKEPLLTPLLDGTKHENGFVMPCVICGARGSQPLQVLSDTLLNFLIKTGTIHTLLNADRVICVSCNASVMQMEQACQLQSMLATKFQKSRLGGRNGDATHAFTAQLLKPGNGVNLPCPVAPGMDIGDEEESTDEENLVISDVKGGIEEPSVSGVNGILDEAETDCHYFKTVSTDTADLAPGESVQLECEVFDLTGTEDLPPDTSIVKREIYIKSPSLPEDTSYDVSQWPNMSENSFGSNLTEMTHSSWSKETSLLLSRFGWKCPMCEMVFESSPILVEHVHSAHSNMKAGETMTCPFCKKQFPTYTQLDDHITQLHRDGSHSCQGCYSVFLRSTLLRRHQQYCGGYERYKEEQRLLFTKSDDGNHGNAQGPQVVSTCSLCLIRFPNFDLLNQHIKECHIDSLDKKYNCEGCKAGFNLMTGLYIHQVECIVFLGLKKTCSDSQYSVLFSCQGCKLAVDNFSTFQDHKQTCSIVKGVLQSEAAASPVKSEDEEYLADDLSRVPDLPKYVDVSSDTLPIPTPKSSDIPDIQSNADKSSCASILDPAPSTSKFAAHTCPDCLVHYEDRGTLDKHIDAVHNQFCDYTYRCAACRGGFMREEGQQLHKTRCKRIKTALQLYSCSECLIPFELRSLLDFHMSIHKDCENRPYMCDGCNAGFAVQTDKLEHEIDCRKIKNSAVMSISESIVGKQSSTLLKVKVEPMEVSGTRNGTLDVKLAQPFSCKICCNQFSYFCDFESHSGSCGKDRSVEAKDEPTDCLSDSNTQEDRPSSSLSWDNLDFSTGQVVCPICDINIKPVQRSQLKCKFKRHMVGHSDKILASKPVRCEACNWGSGIRRTYINHVNYCSKFAQMFPDKDLDKTTLRCPSCFIVFPDLDKTEQHYLSHHIEPTPSDSFSCLGCRGNFSNDNQLQSHTQDCFLYKRALTIPGEGSPCAICFICVSTGKRNGHFADAHAIKNGKYFKCTICTLEFETVRELVVHANTNCRVSMLMMTEPHGTPVRNALLSPTLKVVQEVEENVSEKINVISDVPRSKRFCEICGCRTVTAQHMLIHTASQSRPYHCDGCKGGFINNASLISHETVCVPLKNKRIFGVAVNNDASWMPQEEEEPVLISTDTPTNVEMSLNVDSGEISLACPICNETRSTESKMAIHILNHQNQHQCDICGKSFSYKESLDEHELHCGKLVETKSQSFCTGADDDEVEEWKCLSCCVKFTDETSFLLHIASHEISNINKCFLCYTMFKSAADICMHMVRYHKDYLTTGQKEGTVDNEDEDSDDSDGQIDPLDVSSLKTKTSLTLPNLAGYKSPRSKPIKEQLEEKVTFSDNGFARASPSDFRYDLLTGTKCRVCKRTFKTTAILKRHYGIHDGYYTSICLVCGIGFLKSSQLRVHKAKVHKTPKSTDLVCTKCMGAFEHNFRLVKHKELCICPKNEEVMQCLLCVRKFDTWNKLKSHIWTHLTKCSYCEDKIPVQSRRVEHMLACAKNPVNKGTKTRVLRARDSGADTSLLLDESQSPPAARAKSAPSRKSEVPRKYKCPECCAAFTTMGYLKRHRHVHTEAEYRCRLCGGKFSSLVAKNRHIWKEHKSTNKMIKAAAKSRAVKPEPLKTEPVSELELHTYFTCSTCRECFPSKELKNEHERTAHAVVAKTFNCKRCSKPFPSKFARRRHMQNAHSRPDDQPQSLTCHICTKRFPSNFAKLQHLKKHHKLTDAELIPPPPPKKQRPCMLCSATFEHKSELRAHKRADHPEINGAMALNPARPLNNGGSVLGAKIRSCRHCGLHFAHKWEVKAHMRANHEAALTAASDTATVDTIQPNTFSGSVDCAISMSANMQPIDSVNGVTNMQSEKRKMRQCKDCSKVFESKNELKAHRRFEHKQGVPTMVTVSGETLQILQGRGPLVHAPTTVNNKLHTTTNTSDMLVDLTCDQEDSSPPEKKVKSEILDIPAAPDVPGAPNPPDFQLAPTVETNLHHRCPYCPKSFKLRISLNRHQTKNHPWCP